MKVGPGPLPQHCTSVSQALRVAGKAGLSHVLVISSTETGLVLLNAGSGAPLTVAECVFLLRKAELALLGGVR